MRVRAITFIAALAALALIPSSALAAPKKVQFKFSATSYSAAENAGTFNVTVQRAGNTRVAATILIADDHSGTAATPANYSFTDTTLSFAAGQTSKTVPVTIVDNATANAPNKTVVLRMSAATPAGSQIKTATTRLTIIDNEGPGTLDFSTSAYTVLESGGLATITVNRVGATNLSVSVDYATQASLTNPATSVLDYTPISPAQTLTFAPGEMSKTFQVQVTDDSNAESPENVNLVLSNPKNLTGGAAPQVGPNGPATLTINDDDVSTYSFQSSLFSVMENDAAGHAVITVNRSGATNIASSVNVSTSDGTATSADYTAIVLGTINFAAGETSKTFNVDVTNDGTSEPNETVNLSLISGGNTVATSVLSIVDNDNPKGSVQFSDVAYSATEADATPTLATITVTLSHAVDADVTVNYATSDGTATAGSDYTATNGTLTFVGNTNNGGNGQTSKTFTVPITGDPDPEDDETINLTLSNVAPSGSALAGAPSTAVLTIADNDPPGLLEFTTLSYSASETGGLATVLVHRVGGVGGDVSVDYATSDGSATAGSDYTASSGTLNWASGDSTDKMFTIPVAWDGRGEGTETINVALSNPTGGDLGTNTAAVVRIGDDGASGPLQLTSTSYNVGEADGMVTITVTRSGGSLGGPVTVDYATADGTAAAGSDYAATSGTLTFGPGEASKSFTVPVTSDSTHEDAETFQVTLSNAGGGASLGTPAGATVTIADDDAATVVDNPPPSDKPATTDTPAPSDLQSSPANPNPAGSQTAAADKVAPKLALSSKKLQAALKAKVIVIKVRSNEAAKLALTGKVFKGRKGTSIGKGAAKVATGKTVTIKLKLSKKALAAIRKALAKGKAKVTLTVVATDAAGNKGKAARKLSVK